MTVGRLLALWSLLLAVGLSAVGLAFTLGTYGELRRYELEQRPLAAGIQELLAGTLQAVEESFAYVASGDATEKLDFYGGTERLREEAERMRRDIPADRADLDEERRHLDHLIEHLDHLVAESRVMFAEFEHRGRVAPHTFARYEGAIDDLESAVSSMTAVQREKAAVTSSAVLDRSLVAAASIFAVGVAAALASSMALSRMISAPLRALRDATAGVAEGRLDRPAPPSSIAEVADLGASFNGMAASLRRSRAAEVASRQLEVQLERAQRLESLGVLASGIAHEVNNPLATIASAAEGLLLRLGRLPAAELPERTLLHLELIRDEAFRAKAVARSLLDLAQDSAQPGVVIAANDLARWVQALLALRSRKLGCEVRLELAPDGALRPVVGHQSLLRQVLFNVADNAIDATPAEGGRVVLRTAAVEEHGRSFVELACEDNGPGIPPDIAGRLFEPFFTTKPPGEGRGLGLAVSRRIVERHGGRIRVGTGTAGGARVTILLPVALVGEDEGRGHGGADGHGDAEASA